LEKQYFELFYKLDKPIVVIQPLKYSWTRGIPQPILHVKRKDQIIYENTFQALDSFRSIAVLLRT